MPENVGGIIAAAHAKRAGCPVCDRTCCEPVIIDRTVRNGDYYERLRCAGDETATFRRVWIGGYPKRESALIDPKTKRAMHVTA
ncbi:hypothetical protein [Brevundimonas sp.]|uniref:hypothetical protein n=1 Tax=Brevundimonas sp. TaxID=1871086 RepID=UPI002D3123B2|nr:hypothetical protein [Brevundimonas sp.]HYC66657.1 hypothetical protein [Brevundimonas sp.]